MEGELPCIFARSMAEKDVKLIFHVPPYKMEEIQIPVEKPNLIATFDKVCFNLRADEKNPHVGCVEESRNHTLKGKGKTVYQDEVVLGIQVGDNADFKGHVAMLRSFRQAVMR